MAILTLLSIFAGLLNLPEIFGGVLNVSQWLGIAVKSYTLPHALEIMLMSANTLLIVAVIFYTYKKYAYTDAIMQENEKSIIANKFYIDELYEKIIVRTLHHLSLFFEQKISHSLIDNTINSMALIYLKVGNIVSLAENGNVRFYALYMLIGVVFGFIYLYSFLGASL
jgi:NADH-quinone oxidoreductase subunit L